MLYYIHMNIYRDIDCKGNALKAVTMRLRLEIQTATYRSSQADKAVKRKHIFDSCHFSGYHHLFHGVCVFVLKLKL